MVEADWRALKVLMNLYERKHELEKAFTRFQAAWDEYDSKLVEAQMVDDDKPSA